MSRVCDSKAETFISRAVRGKVLAMAERNRVQLNTGPGKTEQAHKDQCDVNVILRDYQRTGLLKHAKNFQGQYDDVSVQDFQEAMTIVKNAEQMFAELPAAIRQRFDQSPVKFLDFVHDESNREEMEKLGILKGNDGLDVKGAPSNAPTKADVKAAAVSKETAKPEAKPESTST